MDSRSRALRSTESSRFTSRRSSDFSRYGDTQQPPSPGQLANRRRSHQISPASRGYPKDTTDGHNDFSTHRENKAFLLRCAHIQWLRESGAFTQNAVRKWQDTLRYSPSNSARYPLKKFDNALRDTEFSPEDYRIHIHYSAMDEAWVKEWLIGLLEVCNLIITTRADPIGIECSRVIIVLTPELLKGELPPEFLEPLKGKIVLGIKLRECQVPDMLEEEITSTIDVTTTNFTDLTYQTTFMNELHKRLEIPKSVCS